MILLITTCLLLGCFPLQAQTWTKAQVVEDLTFLKYNIPKYNPALPYYQPDFEVLAKRVIQEVPNGTLNNQQYLSLINGVFALSEEGHFSLTNWTDTIYKGFLNNTYAYLPLAVVHVQGTWYIWDDFSAEQGLQRGDVLMAINDQPMAAIVNQLLRATPVDGKIEPHAYNKVQEGFARLYLFHIEQPNAFKIDYLDAEKKPQSIQLKALTKAQQIDNIKQRPKKNQPPSTTPTAPPEAFYYLDYKAQYALLTLPSFSRKKVERYHIKSKRFYRTLFQAFRQKGVQNLVIDLRNNTGGRNELADHMVHFILKPDHQTPFLKKTISWKGQVKTYRLPKPSKNRFEGTVYLLINNKTYSAGSALARYLKEYADAIVIGEETGTRYDGFAAGSRQTITLPHSGIRIGIPRFHILFPPALQNYVPNRGVVPNYPVRYTFEDLLAGRDLELEMVEALMAK